jgi:hypothetical protein
MINKNLHKKLRIAVQNSSNNGGALRCSERITLSAPLVVSVMLLLLNIRWLYLQHDFIVIIIIIIIIIIITTTTNIANNNNNNNSSFYILQVYFPLCSYGL